MKTKLLFALLLISTTTLFSQIPNNGFENWNNSGTHLNPDGWWAANEFVTSGTYYPVTRSTDHYPASVGSYSMRMENNIALFPDVASMGFAWTGDENGSNNPVFPITGHPNSLRGYFKFFPQNNDTMDIHIILYKNGSEVSGGYFKSTATTSTWTSLNIPLSSYTDADSARIMILSCYDNDAPLPHGNSILYVDNLSFDNLITEIPEMHEASSISAFPNPAGNQITVTFPLNCDYLQVFDVLGSQVLTQSINNSNTATLDISQLPQGIYFLKIIDDKGVSFEKKIVVVK